MNLPRAVLEAERKAEEALQRLQQARQPQQQQNDPPPGDPPASDPATTPPPSEPSATANPPAATPPANAEGDDKWEARFKTLSGKYNAEVPRLHAAIKERDAQLNSLTEEVEALKASLAKPRESLVKPEEVNEFGEPLVDLIRRAAREEVSAKDAELAELRRKLESVQVATVESKEVGFYDKLNSMVPDWMAINDDAEFHAWLGEIDELTGAQRQSILAEAEVKRDADRVARFFKAFKKVQQDKAAVASTSLDSQVAPVTSRVDAPPQGKKIWSRGEIAEFYARDRRGEFTPEQAAAIDAEIQSAVAEKRVR